MSDGERPISRRDDTHALQFLLTHIGCKMYAHENAYVDSPAISPLAYKHCNNLKIMQRSLLALISHWTHLFGQDWRMRQMRKNVHWRFSTDCVIFASPSESNPVQGYDECPGHWISSLRNFEANSIKQNFLLKYFFCVSISLSPIKVEENLNIKLTSPQQRIYFGRLIIT